MLKPFHLTPILLFFLAFISCNTQNKEETKKAKALFDSGQYDKALAEYNQAIAASPNDCRLLIARADCNRHLLHFNEAITDLQKATQMGCMDGRAYNNLGDAYLKTNQVEPAITGFKKALDLKYKPGTVCANLGICNTMAGNPDAAEKFFRQAIATDPDSADNYYYLGTLLQQMDSADGALKSLNHAIELKPRFAIYYIKRAGILGETGQFEKALTDLDKAIALNPNDPTDLSDAHLLKALCYKNMNKNAEACNELTELKAINPGKDYSDLKIDCK